MIAADRRKAGRFRTVLAISCALLAAGTGKKLLAQRPAPNLPRDPLPAKLQILPPDDGLLVDHSATLHWKNFEDPDAVDPSGLPSITWYYSPNPQGVNRQRVVTLFHDRFEGDFHNRWMSDNPLRQQWDVVRDGVRRRVRILRSQVGGGPLMSLDQFAPTNLVASVQLRPLPGAGGFGVAVRASRSDPSSYTLRGAAELVNPKNPALGFVSPVNTVAENQWYWYELGVCTMKRRVEVRGRIWDGEHTRVLKTLRMEDIPGQAPGCPQGPLIGLLAGADFAEVYVDPWETRWLSGSKGDLVWDTTNVPNGRYWVMAEIRNQGPIARVRISDFQVTVQH